MAQSTYNVMPETNYNKDGGGSGVVNSPLDPDITSSPPSCSIKESLDSLESRVFHHSLLISNVQGLHTKIFHMEI